MTDAPDARWRRVKGIVAEAIDLPPESRPAWLESACAGDEALRAEATALVGAHERAGAFLEAPALAAPGAAQHLLATTGPPTGGPPRPERIGVYRVLGELGRGGMGIVYLGAREDGAFDQQVAIKVVSGEVAHPAAFRRFEDERRILASLDHPNIAHLIDAGSMPDGQPYVVMEHVAGEAIDRFCEARRLGAAERLRLFARVCAAVQYSHQRLVVHRDIKARNILVSADGVPKLLDFGIAKLLEPDAHDGGSTRTAFRLLTPESASPEQVRGEPVTVATDVYSLGVLLYRLLTGRSPYRGSVTTDAEIVRAVCEEEPIRPSAAAAAPPPGPLHPRDLRGDLDLITLKALRKDPQRRYLSVEQLAQDVERHLGRQPVLAAPDAWTYRARKFVARHWVGLAAAAAVTVALLGGGAATWWQARRAQRRFNDVRKLAHTVMFDVHDAIAPLPGSTQARKLLVTEALVYLDSLATEAGGDASLQRELASGYEKMADVLGRPSAPSLGDLSGALNAYRKAQAARERLLAATPGDTAVMRELAVTAMKISRVLYESGDPLAGADQARKSSRLEEQVAAADPSPLQTFRTARSYANEGYLLYASGLTLAGLDRLGQAITILERQSASGHPEVRPRLAVAYGYRAVALRRGKPVAGVVPDLRAALEAQRKAVAIDESVAVGASSNFGLQRQVMVDLTDLGEILADLGDRRGAREQYDRALAGHERMARADPANVQGQKDVAYVCQRLGLLLAQEGTAREALVLLERSAALLAPVLAADPSNLNTRSMVADTAEGFALAHVALASDATLPRRVREGHWREARARFEDAYRHWKGLRDTGVTKGGVDLAKPDELAREIAKCDAALAGAR